MADAASDVRLDHPIHLRLGDQRNWPVNMLKKRVPGELWSAHEVGRVQLVLVEGVVSEHLNHVGQQADVAQKVELHIIFEALTLKVCKHMLSVGVIGLRTFNDFELVEEGSSWW